MLIAKIRQTRALSKRVFTRPFQKLMYSISFQELKRKYKSKKRNGKNTMEDDIAFMTAKDKEELRVKRIDADQLLRDRALIQ